MRIDNELKELDTIQGFTSEMTDAMNVHLAEAAGQPGEKGDPHYIVLVAEDLIKTYKSVVHWIEDLRLIETDSETREWMIDFIGFGEDIWRNVMFM